MPFFHFQAIEEPEGSHYIRDKNGQLKSLRKDASKNRISNNRLNKKTICVLDSDSEDSNDSDSDVEVVCVKEPSPSPKYIKKKQHGDSSTSPGQGRVSKMIDEHKDRYQCVRLRAHRALKDRNITPKSRKYYSKIRKGLIDSEPDIEAAVDDEVADAKSGSIKFCSQEALDNMRLVLETP